MRRLSTGSFALNALDLSIIIVNFNAGDLLRANLESIAQFVHVSFEVIVVDNASTDDSLERFPDGFPIKIVRNETNVGFAKACNIGVRVSRGQLLHFLNPDARVTDNIDTCYREAQQRPENIYVTRVLDIARRTERSSYPFPTLPNISRMLWRPGKVERWYLGASLVIDRSVLKRLGGWSEDYFMYAEDMDLFYKAARADVRTRISQALVVHQQGATTSKVWSARERLAQVECSALIFARKFGLRLDYFIFRHLAFARGCGRNPAAALTEITVYWRQLILSITT